MEENVGIKKKNKKGFLLQLCVGPSKSTKYTILQKHINSSIQIIEFKSTKVVKCSHKNTLIPMKAFPGKMKRFWRNRVGWCPIEPLGLWKRCHWSSYKGKGRWTLYRTVCVYLKSFILILLFIDTNGELRKLRRRNWRFRTTPMFCVWNPLDEINLVNF